MPTASFKKIKYNDLGEEASIGNLPKIVGRENELDRMSRIINRSISNNIMLVGGSGSGKSSTVYGWIRKIHKEEPHASLNFMQFELEHMYDLENSAEESVNFKEIMRTLPPSVIFIDNFGRGIHNNRTLLQSTASVYGSILKNPHTRVVLTLEPHEYRWLEHENSAFTKLFEVIYLKNQTPLDYIHILENKLPKLNKNHKVIVPTASLEEIVSYCNKFSILGQLPQSAISVLDESLVYTVSKGKKIMTENMVSGVVASKTNIPEKQLNMNEVEILKNLENELNAKIINQSQAISKITAALKRARLGIRNPEKPLGSFLILGPSGVGKTETAKLVAEIMFGKRESFIRFDMSEFAQDHTVQRLIGSPAGYSGHDEGGALTNAMKREPHSLILLDEIEKAHPKIFDIFLQILDDGRLTSGQNETVDATNTIIMATSNAGVSKILEEFAKNNGMYDEKFIEREIIPELSKTFRLEFINRFDHILIFNPLTVPHLVKIAELEIKKIEKRLAKHKVVFDMDVSIIEEKIKGLADPRFGARPVKRFIEETCESLLVNSLLEEQSA